MSSAKPLHMKCRYPNEYQYRGEDGETKRIVRQEVPAGYISWDISYDQYDPLNFTAPFVMTAAWADPRLSSETKFKWNHLDGDVNRQSHEGKYKISDSGEPLNIRGRTGLKGRGVLGRWGPNHAADPLVTRWKRDEDGKIVAVGDKKVLQFVSIQRRDTKEWAIPGGMVDPGEQVSVTVRREFMEEALDSTKATAENKKEMEKMVNAFFTKGQEIYKGYVDDPRNTDNAWMETVVFHFHDEEGDEIGRFALKAGDDAQALKWTDISQDLKLYASHVDFVKKAADIKKAHW